VKDNVPGLSGELFIPTENGTPMLWDQELQDKRKMLRIRGCITYKTFQEAHHTWFCYLFGPANETTPPFRLLGVACLGGDGAD
jgi:hypothetical protein